MEQTLVKTTSVEYINGQDEGKFFFGDDIAASYDELMLWNRVLSSQG